MCRVVHHGTSPFELQLHIRALVFDGLEFSDDSPELDPVCRVLDRGVKRALGATQSLSCDGQRSECERPVHSLLAAIVVIDRLCRAVAQNDVCLLSRAIERDERSDFRRVDPRVYDVEGRSFSGADWDNDGVGVLPVEDSASARR